MDKTKRFNIWTHKALQFGLQNSGLHSVRKLERTSSLVDPVSLGLDGIGRVYKNPVLLLTLHFLMVVRTQKGRRRENRKTLQ